MNLRRWLTPGIGVKRWLLVVFLGLLLLALAFAHLIRQVGLGLEPGGLAGTFIDLVTLQFLPYPLRGLIVGVDRRRSPRRRWLPGDAEHDGSLAHVRRRPAARRGHLPEALPGPRTAHRGHRRRDRAVHAPARPQGAHEQPHGGRDRGRRRRLVRRPPHGARDPARRRHPQLHRRPRGRGAVDERAAPVPIPRRRRRYLRLRTDPAWPATRSATCCSRR